MYKQLLFLLTAMLIITGCQLATTPTPSIESTFSVSEEKDGLHILHNGTPFITDIKVSMGDGIPPKVKHSKKVLPDGAKVWNEWCEDRETRYRTEVALRADGAIEITMTGEMEALNPYMTRLIHLTIPKGFLNGKTFEALEGNGRKYTRVNGVCDTTYKGGNYRWFTADGLIFDFNPLGATDYCSGYSAGAVKGVWNITQTDDGSFVLTAGSTMKNYGGFTGGKIVIREGSFDDYPQYHFINQYTYSQHLQPSRLLAFGAVKTGTQYSNGNLPFDAATGYGWVSGSPAIINGYEEGALYSSVTGTEATYTITGLPDGFYVLTVGAGNYTGADNLFSVDVNGVELASKTTIAPRKVWYLAHHPHHRRQGGVPLQGEIPPFRHRHAATDGRWRGFLHSARLLGLAWL